MAPLQIAILVLLFFHHAILALQRKEETKSAVCLEVNLELELKSENSQICTSLLESSANLLSRPHSMYHGLYACAVFKMKYLEFRKSRRKYTPTRKIQLYKLGMYFSKRVQVCKLYYNISVCSTCILCIFIRIFVIVQYKHKCHLIKPHQGCVVITVDLYPFHYPSSEDRH